MQKKELNNPKRGMTRALSPYLVQDNFYTFMYGGQSVDESGNRYTLSNEHSNILANKFKDGFVVMGFENDIIADTTYFLLMNPETNVSEFGCIRNDRTFQDQMDIVNEEPCDECIEENMLSKPLEEIDQIEHQVYETKLTDECNQCLNLDIRFPIKDIEIKRENVGVFFVFTDGRSEPRGIELDNLDQYFRIGQDNCDNNTLEETCLDCEKLRIFKLYELPKVKDYSRVLGGNLRQGVYEVVVAYTDEFGNELSSYRSVTGPISIFDENTLVREQVDNNAFTNFGIKVDFHNIDQRYTHYKVVIIYSSTETVSESRFEQYVAGTYSTSNNTVVIAETSGETISRNELSVPKLNIQSWQGLTESNGFLFGYGVKQTRQVNLQPIVNLLGSSIKWQSSIAREELYQNADSMAHRGYNRDEVEPFSIEFLTNDGYIFPRHPLIPRPAKPSEKQKVDSTDLNVRSIIDSGSNCDDIIRDEVWQFQNTAVQEGQCQNLNINTVTQTAEIRESVRIDLDDFGNSIIPPITSQNLFIDLSDLEFFTGVEDYLQDNIDNCQGNQDLQNICTQLQTSTYDSINRVPTIQPDCGNFSLIPGSNALFIKDVVNEVLSNIERSLGEYGILPPPQFSTIYSRNTQNELVRNEEFELEYFVTNFTDITQTPNFSPTMVLEDYTNNLVNSSLLPEAFTRVNTFNTNCNSALDLIKIRQGDVLTGTTSQSNHHQYVGFDDISDIKTDKIPTIVDTSIVSVAVDSGNIVRRNSTTGEIKGDIITDFEVGFLDRVHEDSLWFKTEIDKRDKFIIEFSKLSSSSVNSQVDVSNRARVSFFSRCSNNTALASIIIDLSSHNFITLDSSGVNDISNNVLGILSDPSLRDDIFISVETPVMISIAGGDGLNEIYSREDLLDNEVRDFRVVYRNAPYDSGFGIVDREIELDGVNVFFDEVTLFKTQDYIATCQYEVPVISDCEPIPLFFGDFSHYESTEKYPCNDELYNSKKLQISPTDFSDLDYRQEFEDYYVTSIGSEYLLSDETDFQNKNIRHYRFPDNTVSPFIDQITNLKEEGSIIYPLGIKINDNIINDYLDIAVKNELMSQYRRDSIIGYKIYRGDLTLDRSIKSSGLLYDYKRANRDGVEYSFNNFPYNSNGIDKLHFNVTPNSSNQYLWNYHSPETDYFKPTLPEEIVLNGYQFGQSRGYFNEVEDHTKMVIIGSKAKSLARTLATLEVIAEIAIVAAEQGTQAAQGLWFVGGFTNGSGAVGAGVGAGLTAAITIYNSVANGLHRYGRFYYEWITTFRNLGTPRNFAYYYTSVGSYNSFQPNNDDDNYTRGLTLQKYLQPGIFNIRDEKTSEEFKINNLDREKAVLLSVSSDNQFTLSNQYFNYDNNSINPSRSSQPLSSEVGCQSGLSEEILRNIASPYVSLKQYLPNQHGTINSVQWIDTGFCGDLRNPNDCNLVLGGDTYISRHQIKRKQRLFRSDGFEVSDLTPIAYSLLFNITQTRFYIDYEATPDADVGFGSRFLPDINYIVNTDCGSDLNTFYLREPKKFYLYYYGIPNFLTETRINTNFRTARREPENQFYPQNRDYINLTQEKNVPITRENQFFYNSVYSYNGTRLGGYTLPDTYSQEVADRQADNPNSVMYSQQDLSENSQVEPWLFYRPLDYYVFKASYGKLIRLKGIENNQVLGVFENQSVVFNATDLYVNGITQDNAELGNGGIFRTRPRSFIETDLGYLGSQSHSVLSCEYGHFIADSERGQIFKVNPGAQGFEEISKYSNSELNNMDIWFKEHLPFKIRDSRIENYETIDVDNPLNGVGITMGWDSKFRRVLITKKDYKPLISVFHFDGYYYRQEDIDVLLNNSNVTIIAANRSEITLIDENNVTSTVDVDFVKLNDLDVFRDVSWTITYKPEDGVWESYQPFTPNFYISHTDYFQTGYSDESNFQNAGLWSHLLTNKSKQVFNGVKYPWIVEYPTKNEYQNKVLSGISLWTEAKRYHKYYDFSPDDRITFNKSVIFSDRENSGNLELIPNNGLLSQLSKYPFTIGDTQQILISQTNKRWNFNYFYNRVKSNRNNQPIFNWDDNQILKTLNSKAVSFTGKSVLEHMSSEVFLVRLIQDKTTQFDIELKFATNQHKLKTF